MNKNESTVFSVYMIYSRDWYATFSVMISFFRVTLKNLKAWLPRINYKLTTNRLREKFQVSVYMNTGYL